MWWAKSATTKSSVLKCQFTWYSPFVTSREVEVNSRMGSYAPPSGLRIVNDANQKFGRKGRRRESKTYGQTDFGTDDIKVWRLAILVDASLTNWRWNQEWGIAATHQPSPVSAAVSVALVCPPCPAGGYQRGSWPSNWHRRLSRHPASSPHVIAWAVAEYFSCAFDF